MGEHKTKIFKKVFEYNADDVISVGEIKEFVITQSTFVPLMGQMWNKAKERYKEKYHKRYLKFAEWLLSNSDYLPKDKTIEELFWDWRKEN